MLFYTKGPRKLGFSMVEIMVALVLLAIGLLGLVAMTTLVMRGKDSANHLSNSTDICQLKLEELKDISFDNLGEGDRVGNREEALIWGAFNAEVMQEVDLNAQGLSRCGYLDREDSVTGSACNGQAITGCALNSRADVNASALSDPCKIDINEAGPYLYSRSFVVCRGDEYDPVTQEHPDKDPVNINADPALGSAEEHCQASEDPQARPTSLTCDTQDVINHGPDSNEKVIKTLCTWRKKTGRCGFVEFDAYRADNL
jgi:type IV pilus assembly protein PilV